MNDATNSLSSPSNSLHVAASAEMAAVATSVVHSLEWYHPYAGGKNAHHGDQGKAFQFAIKQPSNSTKAVATDFKNDFGRLVAEFPEPALLVVIPSSKADGVSKAVVAVIDALCVANPTKFTDGALIMHRHTAVPPKAGGGERTIGRDAETIDIKDDAGLLAAATNILVLDDTVTTGTALRAAVQIMRPYAPKATFHFYSMVISCQAPNGHKLHDECDNTNVNHAFAAWRVRRPRSSSGASSSGVEA